MFLRLQRLVALFAVIFTSQAGFCANAKEIRAALIHRAEKQMAPLDAQITSQMYASNSEGPRMRLVFQKRTIVDRTLNLARRLGVSLPRDFRQTHYKEWLGAAGGHPQLVKAWEMQLAYKPVKKIARRVPRAGSAIALLIAGLPLIGGSASVAGEGPTNTSAVHSTSIFRIEKHGATFAEKPESFSTARAH
jgi:hypothetical protein